MYVNVQQEGQQQWRQHRQLDRRQAISRICTGNDMLALTQYIRNKSRHKSERISGTRTEVRTQRKQNQKRSLLKFYTNNGALHDVPTRGKEINLGCRLSCCFTLSCFVGRYFVLFWYCYVLDFWNGNSPKR